MRASRRFLDLVGIDLPIVQAPMIGPKPGGLVAAVSAAGGLGSIACAGMSPDAVEAEVSRLRAVTDRPFNLNFFCHAPPLPEPARDRAWAARLAPAYAEFGLDPIDPVAATQRAPFDAAMNDLVERLRPKVVSFHFGLPSDDFLQRVKAAGCLVFASATTVREARHLESRGVDAVIAQGAEAGGHRGMFLSEAVESQVGTFALVPQVVDAVQVPVIAAGGIADARGVAAALVLGASAVQIGTAYLLCPEAGLAEPHRRALLSARDEDTALTNVFTGRPARGILNRAMRELGPMSAEAPAFPRAGFALQPLRAASEARDSGDYSPLWSGQGVALAREEEAGALTRRLAAEAAEMLKSFAA